MTGFIIAHNQSTVRHSSPVAERKTFSNHDTSEITPKKQME